MIPSMVDTQVLSFALAVEPAHDDKTKRLQRDSAALIGGMAEVRVSAIVVLECSAERRPLWRSFERAASWISSRSRRSMERSPRRPLASSRRHAAIARRAFAAST